MGSSPVLAGRFGTREMDMRESMTISEIETLYPFEWVLVENPVTNEAFEVQSGKVLWHSADRDEVYQKAVELHPRHSAFLFTGELSDEVEFVL
jgi:hypothetical protein